MSTLLLDKILNLVIGVSFHILLMVNGLTVLRCSTFRNPPRYCLKCMCFCSVFSLYYSLINTFWGLGLEFRDWGSYHIILTLNPKPQKGWIVFYIMRTYSATKTCVKSIGASHAVTEHDFFLLS